MFEEHDQASNSLEITVAIAVDVKPVLVPLPAIPALIAVVQAVSGKN